MPLHYLLYRCPECGHDPTDGDEDRAHCPQCGADYRREGKGRKVRVSGPAIQDRSVPIVDLVRSVQRFEESDPDRRTRETQVTLRRLVREEPIRMRGRIVGFAEVFSEPESGVLRIGGRTVTFGIDGATVVQWNLLDLYSVQTNSSTIQISPRDGEMFQFRFHDDSPRRWEEWLKELLQQAYDEEGLGTIAEYQPRITTR